MKALVYEGPETLVFREAADPVVAEDEALVRVHSVGICGSDMHAYLGHDARRPAPLILGHEAAGVVEGGTWDGRRVTINPLVSCGKCRDCIEGHSNICAYRQIMSMPPRQGSFAEYAVAPMRNLVDVPDDVSFDQASLVEPLACGWHAVRLAMRQPGRIERALIIGGGAIGVGGALALRAQGVTDCVLVELTEIRAATVAEHLGIPVFHPDDPSLDPDFDVVFDGVGIAATRALASKLCRQGGVIVHVGLGSGLGGLDARRMTLQEIGFFGCYTYTEEDFRETAAALFEGRKGDCAWIETRALAGGAQAFADIRGDAVAVPKIVLNPF